MKTYLISSPAYKANGLNGTNLSIAICEDNGDFLKIIGDHAKGIISNQFFYERYKSIHEISGLSFSDSDRFISTKEADIDLSKLDEWESEYTTQYKLDSNWWELRGVTFGDLYSFLYKKGGAENKENMAIYDKWLSENKKPVLSVKYYDFLKSIKE